MPPGRGAPRRLAPGDWNAFFGLALDNTTQFVILSSLLIGVFKLVLGNGFIVTARLWGWALVSIIDGRLGAAAAVFAACAAATLFGLIQSPLPSGALFWPWSAAGSGALAAAYGIGGALLAALARAQSRTRGGR